MSTSIKKNYLFSILYQVVTLVLPLITIPYISRVLGAEGVGINSYTNSMASYFILIGCLGTTMYGSRQIAYVRDDKNKLSKEFWSIEIIRLISVCSAFIIYIFVFGFNKKYGNIYLLQSLCILAMVFDISWFFMGLEEFKVTVTRGLVIKILCVIGIFIFVKDKNDLWKYVLLNGLTAVLGNIALWFYLPKKLVKIKLKISDIKKHSVSILKLFIPQIAVQLATIIDKTMIGFLSTEVQVGYYEQSVKIATMSIGLLTALGTVMMPHMSNAFANGQEEKMKKYLNLSLRAVSFVSIPMLFGLIGIAKEFVPWFFGSEFNSVIILLIILSPRIYLISINNVFGMQYLMPRNKNKEYTYSITLGAIANIVLNFILIQKYKALGACIGTVISELIITILQYKCVRKDINIKEYVNSVIKYVLSASIMCIIVRVIGNSMGGSVFTNIVQVICGLFVYEVILLIMKEEFNLSILKNIKNKFTIKK